MEIWKDIEGYEGYYQVSNWGNVRSLDFRRRGTVSLLRQNKASQGYLIVRLFKNKKWKNCYVHRLVGMAFLENPNCFKEINHKDENKQNNHVDNLEWCTPKFNTNYSRLKHPERYFTTINGKRTTKKTKYSSIPINQLSLNGDLIKKWNNIAEIVRTLKFHNTAITECCQMKREKAYGYKWEFAEKSTDSLFI